MNATITRWTYNGQQAELRTLGNRSRISCPGHRLDNTQGDTELMQAWLRSAGFREVA